MNETNEHRYDYAGVDNNNPRNAPTKQNLINLETINNPYYDSDNEYVNDPNQNPQNAGSGVDTIKIVNNVYYE